YLSPDYKNHTWRKNMRLNKGVEVKELPKMTVAYIRHMGPYKGDEQLFEHLWNRLLAWAGPRQLLTKDMQSLSVYHDDPTVTSEDKHRVSVCITVPPETEVSGEVGKMSIDPARYAVARFGLTSKDFEEAWDWVYGQWLPENGYQPEDKPYFEMYHGAPKDGVFEVDICIPVKPL
ncbi:MAG: GyrI-like domain-containing protein, partial [Bacteroidota bacterium]